MGKWKTFKELETEKVRTFNVIDRRYNSVMNINKIHPLKQDKIYHLVTDSDMQDIRKIWIFGSDFDLLVSEELDKNKQFYDNVMKTRRLVYECAD